MLSDDTRNKEFKLELYTTLQLCEVVNSPRSLAVFILLNNEEWGQYLDLPMCPDDYLDVERFRDDYLVTKVLSKSPNIPFQVDRKAAAIRTFLCSETSCLKTNDLISQRGIPLSADILHRMTSIIHSLLHELTPKRIDKIISLCAHGPGSTTGVRSTGRSVADKYQHKIDLTTNLYPFARSIMGERCYEYNVLPRAIKKGNRFITVPKTAKTDRGICIEPTLNVFLQKGIGKYIRRRLAAFGLDLDTQAEVNRKLASSAMRDGLATIDLEAASDSISKVLIERLLPPDWVHLLFLARSPQCRIDGMDIQLEKISSMGNGFTFELESLLFWALCKAVVPDRFHNSVSVFGDDIIVPQKHASAVITALNQLGFRVNSAKSFLEGNFFESCGTDWFYGENVRPFYLKGSKQAPYSVSIANKLRKYCSYKPNGQCDLRFRPLWLALVKMSPKIWQKCRVPELLGDSGIIVSSMELPTLRGSKDGWEGYYIQTMPPRPLKKRLRGYGVLLNGITSIGRSEVATKGFLPLRGFLRLTKPRWTLLSKWPGGLEWTL